MSVLTAPAPAGPAVTIRGRAYPVLLPKLSDPRLHLAATCALDPTPSQQWKLKRGSCIHQRAWLGHG